MATMPREGDLSSVLQRLLIPDDCGERLVFVEIVRFREVFNCGGRDEYIDLSPLALGDEMNCPCNAIELDASRKKLHHCRLLFVAATPETRADVFFRNGQIATDDYSLYGANTYPKSPTG
jgi:hypothetical protein